MEEEEFDIDEWREDQYVDEYMLRLSLMTEEERIREYMRRNSGRFDDTVVTFDDSDGSLAMAVVVASSGSPAGQPETYIITDGAGYGLMNGSRAPLLGMDYDRIELLDWNFAILHKDGKVGFYIDMSDIIVDPEYDEVVAEPGEPVRVRKGDEWGFVIEECGEEPEGGCPDDHPVCRRLDLSRF